MKKLSRDELLARREEILKRVGADLEEFTARAHSFSLVGEEWDAWDQLQNIAFLLDGPSVSEVERFTPEGGVKAIEAHLERVWVAYCSRCNAETLIYRDRVDEAAQELVNNGWRWYERSKRLFCRLCATYPVC